MRKTDQVLMWEAFEGSISQGGPLGGSSKSSSLGQSSGNDSEESDAPGLMGLLAQVLQGVEDGSIDEGEACDHLSMILSGEAEAMEDESPEEQDMEDEDEDSMEDEEYGEDEEQDEDEAPIKKLEFPSKTKHSVRDGFPKEKSASNFKKSHNVPVRNRNTHTQDQRGI